MAKLHPEEAAYRIRETGIIAIIRGKFMREQLVATAEALAAGGVEVLEVTLNTPGALEGISHLRREVGDRLLVGAGTVRTQRDVDLSLDASAQFLVSPNYDSASVKRSQERIALHLPGVFTASEAEAAFAAGCPLLKLFPADVLGPPYLAAIRAPLNDIAFVPTGGIDIETIPDYLNAGAAAFGVGSALVRGPEQDPAELSERAARFVTAVRQARGE